MILTIIYNHLKVDGGSTVILFLAAKKQKLLLNLVSKNEDFHVTANGLLQC